MVFSIALAGGLGMATPEGAQMKIDTPAFHEGKVIPKNTLAKVLICLLLCSFIMLLKKRSHLHSLSMILTPQKEFSFIGLLGIFQGIPRACLKEPSYLIKERTTLGRWAIAVLVPQRVSLTVTFLSFTPSMLTCLFLREFRKSI